MRPQLNKRKATIQDRFGRKYYCKHVNLGLRRFERKYNNKLYRRKLKEELEKEISCQNSSMAEQTHGKRQIRVQFSILAENIFTKIQLYQNLINN